MMCSVRTGASRDMATPDVRRRHLHPSGDSVPGSDAVEIMGLRDVLDGSQYTSNRVDCSVIGMARGRGKAFHAPVAVTPAGNGEIAT